MNSIALSEEDVAALLAWIDEIPISRPKKNITRDFSDGVATAEVVHHFCPKLIELFMYSPANAVSQKMYNWNTLNQKVFRKLGYVAHPELISCVVANKPGYVEYLLFELRHKIEAYCAARRQNPSLSHDQDSVSEESYLPSLPANNATSGHAFHPPSKLPQQQNLTQIQQLQQQQFQQQLQQQQYQNQQQAFLAQQQLTGIPGAAESIHGMLGGGGEMIGGLGGQGVKKGGAMIPQAAATQQQHQGKDFMIRELQETVQILQLKITKLEQLLILKDRRIDELLHTAVQQQ
ncbi:hypothetical protein BC830DRAFT_1136277 [Chytriomyces sp. MP71]|nr:hypothetical protein BC830DRAFT_1136277 [Chytriomyces sp. MP71]